MQVHTDIQAISFWLLKYESYIREVDLVLRKIFDEWGSKQRDISLLQKYRKFNLDKIERAIKEIAIREEVIKAGKKEAEREIEKKRQEAIRRRSSIVVSRIHACHHFLFVHFNRNSKNNRSIKIKRIKSGLD
ncbi:uncharacterized protein TNCT_440881 [Trichonephila clavata]|uniref:Uncharacterized protein n=1 Tax=Trichonephila clavata TaxID=2740835 RepID=A0A8X6GCA7_TRICU|nr:uncharacterized protein TNCT_440881 [Trichonephila clavata]